VILAWLVFVLISAQACSVKEDRRVCPCNVTVISDGKSESCAMDKLELYIHNDKSRMRTHVRKSIDSADFVSGKVIEEVPKGWFHVAVIGGEAFNTRIVGDTLAIITEGNQSDSLWTSSLDCYAYEDDDRYEARCRLYKQFCSLSIRIEDSSGKPLPYDAVLEGSFDGFSLMDLKPHAGKFLFRLSIDETGRYSARVPRQGDNSLCLAISKDGSLVESVPIGKMISDSGYSWGTSSLDDIELVITYGSTGFYCNVNGWEAEEICFVVDGPKSKAVESDVNSVLSNGMKLAGIRTSDKSELFSRILTSSSGVFHSGEYWPNSELLDFIALYPPNKSIVSGTEGYSMPVDNFDGMTDILTAQSFSNGSAKEAVPLKFCHILTYLASLECKLDKSQSNQYARIRAITLEAPSSAVYNIPSQADSDGYWNRQASTRTYSALSSVKEVSSAVNWTALLPAGLMLLPTKNGSYSLSVSYSVLVGSRVVKTYDARKVTIKLKPGYKNTVKLIIPLESGEITALVNNDDWSSIVNVNETI